jgi:hypothetical protein
MRYKLSSVANAAVKYIAIPMLVIIIASRSAAAGSTQILTTIEGLKDMLAQIGPALSAVLFIIAGIFYAIGQMLPPDKKANFHTAAVNIIIGAVVVGALSVASTSLALASTHLLSNFTNAS